MQSPGDNTTGHIPSIKDSFNSKAEIQKEFHALIMLLVLVTAINDGGCSTLQQDYVEHYNGLFDTTLLSLNNMISAVAAILMWDYRAIAAAIPYFNSVLNESGCYIYVTTNEEPQPEGTNIKDHGITVVPTAAHTDTQQHPHNVVITKGTSHFNQISDENWNCFKIP